MSTNKSIWDDFTNLYSLNKTLRFELRPVGRTLENIKNTKNITGLNLINEDEERAKEYKEIKQIIDDYHRGFIERALKEVELDMDELDEFYNDYKKLKKLNKNKKENYEKINKVQTKITKQQEQFRSNIREIIEKTEGFHDLFNKNLIQKVLFKWLKENNTEDIEEKKRLIEKFNKWTTYFEGFHKNRKNIYDKKEIQTSIIYRIIHDNLPKFLDDLINFQKLKEHKVGFGDIVIDLADEFEGKTLDEIFSIENFNNCLNQSGIDKFNCIIGGKQVEGEKEERKGVNNYINEYSQKLVKENKDIEDEALIKIKQKAKNIRSLKMTSLFKQILNDREGHSFIPEKLEDDKQTIETIKTFYKSLTENKIIHNFKNLFGDLKEYKLEKVYLKNDKSVTDISQFIFKDYGFIKRALRYYCEKEKFPFKNPNKPLKKEIRIIDSHLDTKYLSIYELEKAINFHNNILDKPNEISKNPICDYFSNFEINDKDSNKEILILNEIKKKYKEVEKILNNGWEENKKSLTQKDKEKDVEKIKNFLDSILNLFQFVKGFDFYLKKKDEEKNFESFEKDGNFYENFERSFEILEEISPLYDKVRNYITQKPYSVEKFKLNFENSTLAGGWDLNMEKANTCVILRKDNLFYLGVMNKKCNKVFEDVNEVEKGEFYEKMVYKQIADCSKDIQNLMVIDGKTVMKKGRKEKEGPNAGQNLQLEKLKNTYLPNDINEIRRKKTYLEGEGFLREDLDKFIDYYKERLDYWDFDFEVKETKDYTSFNDFTRDIGSQGYKISFKKISNDYINKLVDEGKFYLFKIWSKDFSKFSTGNKNLHTLYWKALFDENNLKDVKYELDGKAELFYRKNQ